MTDETDGNNVGTEAELEVEKISGSGRAAVQEEKII